MSADGVIREHRLDLHSLDTDEARFAGAIDVGNGRMEFVTLSIPPRTWLAMNRPITLTVTAVAEPPP